jgi:hypothetical protein
MGSRATRVAILSGTLVISAVFAYLALRNTDFGETWAALRRLEYQWLVPAILAFLLSIPIRAIRWRVLFEADRRPPLGATTNAMLLGVLLQQHLARARGRGRARRRAEALRRRVACRIVRHGSRRASVRCSGAPLAALRNRALAPTCFVVAERRRARNSAPHRSLMRSCGDCDLGRAADPASPESHHEAATLSWYGRRQACCQPQPRAFASASPWSRAARIIIPAAPAALGVFEAAAIATTRAYGVPQSQGLAYAVVLHALNFLPYILGGLVLLGTLPRHASMKRS